MLYVHRNHTCGSSTRNTKSVSGLPERSNVKFIVSSDFHSLGTYTTTPTIRSTVSRGLRGADGKKNDFNSRECDRTTDSRRTGQVVPETPVDVIPQPLPIPRDQYVYKSSRARTQYRICQSFILRSFLSVTLYGTRVLAGLECDWWGVRSIGTGGLIAR